MGQRLQLRPVSVSLDITAEGSKFTWLIFGILVLWVLQ
jgi:hypothetical protein